MMSNFVKSTLALTFALSLSSAASAQGQQGIPVATMTIAVDPTVLTIVERFDVPLADQDTAVSLVKEYISTRWTNLANFKAAAVLARIDHDGNPAAGGGVSIYSQWKVEDAAKSPVAVPEESSLVLLLNAYKNLDSRTLTLDFTMSNHPTTEISVVNTPITHFGLFTVAPENQMRLIELARETAPTSLDVPDLDSVAFHHSLDSREVINFGGWKSLIGLPILAARPGFGSHPYWESVAEFDNNFFNVSAVFVGK